MSNPKPAWEKYFECRGNKYANIKQKNEHLSCVELHTDSGKIKLVKKIKN